MNRKTTIISIILVFCLFGSTFAQDGELSGDANCDGAVNVLDVITISQYFIGQIPDPFCFENADVNGDGVINVLDIVLTVDIFADDDPGDGTVTDIDGNVYQTVIIGSQEWMAENLRVTRYNNGDDIATDLSNADWQNNTSGAYAVYSHDLIPGLNSDEEVLQAYGALYNWYAVDTGNLCPAGWSVSSDADWTELLNYLASQGFPNSNISNGAANALKSCRQIGSPLGGDCNTTEHPRWSYDDTHYGFDEFGFSALPGGYRWTGGTFLYLGAIGYWWSSTEDSPAFVWYRDMTSYNGVVIRYSNPKANGYSVRCVRDIDN